MKRPIMLLLKLISGQLTSWSMSGRRTHLYFGHAKALWIVSNAISSIIIKTKGFLRTTKRTYMAESSSIVLFIIIIFSNTFGYDLKVFFYLRCEVRRLFKFVRIQMIYCVLLSKTRWSPTLHVGHLLSNAIKQSDERIHIMSPMLQSEIIIFAILQKHRVK